VRNWLLLPLWLLGACQSLGPDYNGEESGYRLTLHQTVRIPPGKARIYIQNGRVVGTGFDSYQASCSLEVRHLGERAQRIEPDTFVVNRIQQFFEEVASSGWAPARLAGLGLAGAAVDGGPSMIYRGWHFWLHSRRQPNVLRLSCRGVFADPWEADPPTFDEIAAALGDVATLAHAGGKLAPGKLETGSPPQ